MIPRAVNYTASHFVAMVLWSSRLRVEIAQLIKQQAGWSGFESHKGNIVPFTIFRLAVGPTQPPIQYIPEVLSLGVKRSKYEANHSPPSSAGQQWWSCTSTPLYIF
jgi:hypothetical protein